MDTNLEKLMKQSEGGGQGADTVAIWANKLLDLGKRNPLLSIRKRGHIPIYTPDINLATGVLKKKSLFGFDSAEYTDCNNNEDEPENFRLSDDDESHKQYATEKLNSKVLIANMAEEELRGRLRTLRRKGVENRNNLGVDTLYIAIGVLSWTEDNKKYRAPLILAPVNLERSSRGIKAPIKLQITDELPSFNTTLIEFLNSEYGIDLSQFRDQLPVDETVIDVSSVLQVVSSKIEKHPNPKFEVSKDILVASFLFGKELMWRDLKQHADLLKENQFVKHLLNKPSTLDYPQANFVAQEQVDSMIPPAEIYTPLNCDSSQLVAVEASTRRQDFVLEGPPGTGKSETIANIICHNLARGKKVLFVAQKMVALNVVYSRLERIGLGHLCLELHSDKVNGKNKKEFYANLLEALNFRPDHRNAITESDWDKKNKSLSNKRTKLNKFASALHKKGLYGLSARDAIARKARYEDQHKLDLDSIGWGKYKLYNAPIKNKDELDKMVQAAGDLVSAHNSIASLDKEIFRTIKQQRYTYSWRGEAVNCLSQYKSVIQTLYDSANDLSKVFDIQIAKKTLHAIWASGLLDLTKIIYRANECSIGYLTLKGSAKDKFLEGLLELRKKKGMFDSLCDSIGHNVTHTLIAETPAIEWHEARTKSRWYNRFFVNRRINRAAKELGYEKFNHWDVLPKLVSAHELIREITSLSTAYEGYEIWQGWDTTADSLEQSHKFAIDAYKLLENISKTTNLSGTLCDDIIHTLTDSSDTLQSILKVTDSFIKQYETYKQVHNEAEELNLDFQSYEDTPLSKFAEDIDYLLENRGSFNKWCFWLVESDRTKEYDLVNLLYGSGHSSIRTPDDAKEQLFTAFCIWLAPRLIDSNTKLNEFIAANHDKLISDFRKIDKGIAGLTGNWVINKIYNENPYPLSNVNRREIERLGGLKKPKKPIRRTIKELGVDILNLKPCVMASPLSVAPFLPIESFSRQFDLVVFDEASQIYPWDAVGAIARGKNVIVVGDQKQLPPTNFFLKAMVVDDNDDEDDDNPSDFESVLDLAITAGLKKHQLRGHYRSQHDSLIAFSNSKYYKNSLITYPPADTKRSAVTFHRVNGIYAKGGSRDNMLEAQAVVDEIIRRLKDPKLSRKTIGVVTLNSAQQETIENLLYHARVNDPEIEPYFESTDEYDEVFVKNLESVQGDERDVIILSLVYGPNEQGSTKMGMNFGPLNREGGERRLNVAVTRAKSEVLVFASFDSSMMKISSTTKQGVKDIKDYLEFAQKGPEALKGLVKVSDNDHFDSDFEEAVAVELRNKGWDVQTQVGVSGYRIDLGITHPDYPGRYLAGVECDGASYHSSLPARDRDRIRQDVLENLGWNIIRLWSTDYFNDPKGSIQRIDAELKSLLKSESLTKSSPPPPPQSPTTTPLSLRLH